MTGSLLSLAYFLRHLVFLLSANTMRILPRRRFKQELLLNDIFCCGMMFIGIVVQQAGPSDGLLQTKRSRSGINVNEITRNTGFIVAKIVSIRQKLCFHYRNFFSFSSAMPPPPLTQKHFSPRMKK